ncbi:MAG: putative toxin-antitoxin system toxin component, PIN family [Salinivirgaceae bacterium]|nr:putative toxin-antitoxin system toxin component, PIN family [Salinivirgaceae bacterium]
MKVLFDTNLWVSFMIGKRLSSIAEILCDSNVEIYICEQQIIEIQKVISRPKFDKLIPAVTRNNFFEMIFDVCKMCDITVRADSKIRDENDLYLLSMAESVPVDCIVSGDKDLTDLGSHALIPILKYNEFVDLLKNITY